MDEQHSQDNIIPEDLQDAQQGLFDEQTLTAYVRDLTICAANLHVRLKIADGVQAQEESVNLEQAIDALRKGDACGAQIRYNYQGIPWADTITATARGLEITRLELPQSTPSNLTPADDAS